MENSIIQTIEKEIRNRKISIDKSMSEISVLENVLKIYTNGHSTHSNDSPKRKYVKSGKYSKRKSRKIVKDLKRIKWKKLIINTLKQSGKPLTSNQIINRLFSGRHKSTLKVLKRKISVVLTIYKNNGILKTNKVGRGCKYSIA